MFADYQTRRGLGQSQGGPDFGDALGEDGFHTFHQPLVGFRCRFQCFLVLGAVPLEFQIAPRDIFQWLAIKLHEMPHEPLVDTVRQQQHLYTPLAKHLQMGTVFGCRVVFCHHVPNGILAFPHALAIIGQGHCLLSSIRVGGRETQQLRDFFPVVKVFGGPLLEDFPKGFPETLIVLGFR